MWEGWDFKKRTVVCGFWSCIAGLYLKNIISHKVVENKASKYVSLYMSHYYLKERAKSNTFRAKAVIISHLSTETQPIVL